MTLRSALRRFWSDTRASVSLEALILMPAMFFALAATFTYWDTFRVQNANSKASFTVADMISREMTSVNTAYITGLHQMYRYMTATDEETWMRVTSVQFRASDNTYRVLWSRTTSPTRAPAHTNTTIAAARARLPRMANDDTVIVLETWQMFTPLFRIGVEPRIFNEFIVTPPRWLSPIPITS